MGQSWPLFVYFRSFLQHFYRKIADVSGIRTRIVRVEGEQTDHLTSTTTDHFFNTYFPFSHYSDNVIPACASLPLSGQVKFILYKVVAALLTAWLLLIQEDQGSNPVIGKFYAKIYFLFAQKTKDRERTLGIVHSKKYAIKTQCLYISCANHLINVLC